MLVKKYLSILLVLIMMISVVFVFSPASSMGATVRYEAESAVLSGGASINTNHAGYSGTGFVDGYWNSGAATTFTVNTTSGGSKNVILGFSNGNGSVRTVSVYVNGIKIRQTSLSATSNWDTWSTSTEALTLNTGSNTIALKYDTGDTGNVNLDYIEVQDGSTPTPTPTSTPTPAQTPGTQIRYEAESADLSGGAKVNTDHTGYSGTGFVDGYWNQGASAAFTVSVSPAGNRNVTLRYSNGNGAARTISIFVNGIKIKQTSLAATSNWDAWGTLAETLTLSSGNNTITYRYDTGDTGSVNLDYIEVPSVSTPTPTPTPMPTTTPTPTSTSASTPTPVPPGGNIVVNPGFENGFTGWAGFGGSAQQTTSQYHSGSAAAMCYGRTDTWNSLSQDITSALSTSGNGYYSMSSWLRLATGSDSVQCMIQINDGGGSHWVFGGAANANSSSWVQSSATNLAVSWTGTLSSAIFYVQTTNSLADLYVDDCSIIRTGTLPTPTPTPSAGPIPTPKPIPEGLRGRPVIHDNTIWSDKDTLLRGGTIWLINGSQHEPFIDWANTADCWNTFGQYRLNAVRIACGYNPLSNPFGDPTYPLSQYITWLDDFISRAAEKHMYVMIDYHPGINPLNSTLMQSATEFWNIVAPRYKNWTNVIYEVANEPVAWRPMDYTAQDIQYQQTLYSLVRSLAPDTPIVLMSYAVSMNQDAVNSSPTMKSVTDQLAGIDWTRTLVGFHGYWVYNSQGMAQLKASYPVVNTEFMSPINQDMGAWAVDGTTYQNQAMENMNCSWFGWNYNDLGPDSLPGMYSDAVAKGYWWPADPQ